jgi:orotate phosphoribosyltransferase
MGEMGSGMIVEDLVTSGLSVFETVAPLEAEELVVKDVVVLLDRGQGGRHNVEARGASAHRTKPLLTSLHPTRTYLAAPDP